MKKLTLIAFLLISLQCWSQTIEGYWYGNADVKTANSTNNYLIELILRDNKGYVQGVMNYYFKNTYRSLSVRGTYNSMTRQLVLSDIPLSYHGSIQNLEVDCNMDFYASLRVAKVGSNLVGSFKSKPAYKYVCVDVNFDLKLNADVSKTDSIMNAIRHFKETYQVWRPTATDTLSPVIVVQRKVINYVVDKEFKERETTLAGEITVDSDTLSVDFFDNGEVDGDSISIFFNNSLLSFSRRLSTRAIHFDLGLDQSKDINEISMFADNLGAIPPNTALMIVTDGKKKHEIRMTSSLEKNATIRIKRRKK